jgi:hypothetical protein
VLGVPFRVGFCGLVKISDDEAFTTLEQGFIGRPREARPVKADTPGTAHSDLFPQYPLSIDTSFPKSLLRL